MAAEERLFEPEATAPGSDFREAVERAIRGGTDESRAEAWGAIIASSSLMEVTVRDELRRETLAALS